MTGVDKLEITLNDHPESNNSLGVLLQDIINAAPSINYMNAGKHYRKDNKNSAIKLAALDGSKRDIIIEFQNRSLPYSGNRESVPIATRLVVNPNHFDSWNAFNTTIQTLNEIVPESLITSGFIRRIDFNVDHNMNPAEFRRSLDVNYKQFNTTYYDTKTGQTETIYWGKGDDVLLAYDRHALFDKLARDDLMTNDVPRMRIERQIRRPRLIKKLAGLSSHPTYNDLHHILTNVANGQVSPLEHVTMGTFNLPSYDQLKSSQIYELGKLCNAAESVCYGHARRKFSGEDILDKCSFVPYQDNLQPPAKLAEGIRNYLSG